MFHVIAQEMERRRMEVEGETQKHALHRSRTPTPEAKRVEEKDERPIVDFYKAVRRARPIGTNKSCRTRQRSPETGAYKAVTSRRGRNSDEVPLLDESYRAQAKTSSEVVSEIIFEEVDHLADYHKFVSGDCNSQRYGTEEDLSTIRGGSNDVTGMGNPSVGSVKDDVAFHPLHSVKDLQSDTEAVKYTPKLKGSPGYNDYEICDAVRTIFDEKYQEFSALDLGDKINTPFAAIRLQTRRLLDYSHNIIRVWLTPDPVRILKGMEVPVARLDCEHHDYCRRYAFEESVLGEEVSNYDKRMEMVNYFDKKLLQVLVTHLPVLPNHGTIEGSLKACGLCVLPSWAAFFSTEVDGDYGYCEHGGELRIISYSDQTYQPAVHVLHSLGNLLLIDITGAPNLVRTTTIFRLTAPLDETFRNYGWMTQYLLDQMNLSDVYCQRHRYAKVEVDLSMLLWYCRLACAPSSDSFRKNLREFLEAFGGSPIYWAKHALSLSVAWHVYSKGMNSSSPSLNSGDWAMFPIVALDAKRNDDWVDCSGITKIRAWEPKMCDKLMVVANQLASGADGGDSDTGSFVSDCLQKEEKMNSIFRSNFNCKTSSSIPVRDDSDDVEKPEKKAAPARENFEEEARGKEEESDSEEEEVGEQDNPHRPSEQEDELRREIEKLMDECEIPDEQIPMDDLPIKLKFVAQTVQETKGSHHWMGEHMVPCSQARVKITEVKPNELTIKTNVSVMHAQVFGDRPHTCANDSVNQALAVLGRLGKKTPVSKNRYKYKGVCYRRLSHKDVQERKFWKQFSVRKGDVPEWDQLWEGGKKDVESFIAKMGKTASRKRMLKLLSDLMEQNVTWDESLKIFKVFCKSEKGKDGKPRLIQFAPSILMIWICRKIEAVVAKIKKVWTWTDWRSGTNFVWASGMTQKQLSDAKTKAVGRAGKTVFLCGDDNTDQSGDADAGSYDTTQKEYFFALQCVALEALGFTEEEIGIIHETHKGKRRATGFKFKIDQEALPSGAPWTLFLNTIGLVIFHMQVDSVRNWARMQESKLEDAEVIEIAAQLMGLDMKFVSAASINGEDFSGSEFLKGIFVNGKKRGYWVQLPSRLMKWPAKVCVGDAEKTHFRKNYRSHLKSVAQGQEKFILDPLTRIWVDAWKDVDAKKISLPYDWSNVAQAKEEFNLNPEDEQEWLRIWEQVMEVRYGIDAEKYAEMRAQLKAHATDLGSFEGAAWSKLWRRDYLGEIVAV